MKTPRFAVPLSSLGLLFLLSLLTVGCVSKSELETCQAEVSDLQLRLEAMEADNTLLTEENQKYSDRFFNYVEALPSEYQALELEVEGRLDEQLADFDETTQREIREQFDVLRAGLGKQFSELQGQIKGLQKQSAGTTAEVRGARDQLDEIQRMAALDVEALREKTETATVELNALISNIQNWDNSRVHCRKKSDCPETLSLNKEEGHAVSTFHAQLVQDLNRIQGQL
jgi:predicted  nucleic acid-binding Zn-ribbon protein